MSRLPFARRALIVAVATGSLLTLDSPAALAATGIVKTSGAALTVRTGPGGGYASAGSVANGRTVTITCQTRGTTVTGPFGTSSIWDKITSPAGYVSDAYIYTGSDGTVAPPCIQTVANDYPYTSDSWHQADPWNFYKRECVSWAAWRVRQRLGVDFHNHFRGVHWGNADNWDDAARAVGIRVDDTAKVGSVAQWNSGTFGHVAYVARVNSDGTVLLEEYNKGGAHLYGTRTVTKADVENYLHF
ncbi:CHAP domain-containing protein [Thermomonospora umbrina]|uniref:Surface antigen n=1 Tax=Thermomonospora umbrina TaxID=111806 RepID=A0A3D9SSG3_9ACTN|nr:CHAP domain-containing protein [Thermomonospora umbrina]REE97410.1 surface antigen [Thermomonospora umbrina]